MKKLLLIILSLVFVPQMLFSQIKKIDKIKKEKIHKKIKENNTGDINTKTISAYPDYTSTTKCFYNATPQGFFIEIINLKHNVSGAQSHIIIVGSTKPKVYSFKRKNVKIHPPSEKEIHLGKQTLSHGILDNGNGWVRDESGIVLLGEIYLYVGEKFTKNIYKGSRQVKQLLGYYSGDCSPSSLNFTTQHHTTNVPIISGASIAFNNHSELQASSGNGTHTDWAGQLYKDYRAANGQPGWNYTMVEYDAELNNGLIGYYFGNWRTKGNVSLNKLTTQAEYDALRLQIRRLNYEKYVALSGGRKFIFKEINNTTNYSITPLDNEDIPFEEIIRPDNIQNINSVIPIGLGTSGYPEPNPPITGGGAYNTKKIYPSYLYDVPKSQSWYAGNSIANQIVAPGVTKYKHEPLPSYCNPNNDDYIQPAFLNPLVLEELRQDWSFLTEKNVQELKAKGYDFYDEFLSKFYEKCTIENSVDFCDNQIMTVNPNLPRKTYLDPNGTMPVINNSSNTQINTEKSFIKDEANTLPRPKMLIKTEDYYSDLINNKLITMNPEWLTIKQQNKCKPKYKAIKGINHSINTGKKFKKNKFNKNLKKN